MIPTIDTFDKYLNSINKEKERAKSSYSKMKNYSATTRTTINTSCCTKKFMSNKLIKDSTLLNNLCSDNCLNLQLIRQLQTEIKKLAEVNFNLENINECLMRTIKLKEAKLVDIINSVNDPRLESRINHKYLNTNTKGNELNNINIKTKYTKTSSSIFNKKKCQTTQELKNLFFDDKLKFKKKSPILMNDEENFNFENLPIFVKNENSKDMDSIDKVTCEKKNQEKNSSNDLKEINSRISLTTGKSVDERGVVLPEMRNKINKEIPIIITTSINDNDNKKSDKLSKEKKKEKKEKNEKIENMDFVNTQNKFYDKLFSLVTSPKPQYYNKSKPRSSFLSLNNNQLDKIVKYETLDFLKKICHNEDDFIEFFRNANNDILSIYSDTIHQTIKDLESSIHLIKRMKDYIKITSGLYNKYLISEVRGNLIKDSIEIMECDRVSIFVYESYSDMLIIHSGSGVERNEIRIPKNQGIVGEVFSKGKILRIDDCYSDERFDSTHDKKSNYKSCNMLTAPLIDRDGYIYGVIQSLNKNNDEKFTNDDEEMIKLLGMHIGRILDTIKTNDENVNYVTKLISVISIKNKLMKIKTLKEVSSFIENSVMNIFCVQYCNLFFYNKLEDNLIKLGKYENIEKNLNTGIVGYVYAKKEFFGINSINNCDVYNKIIDIETGMGILTYPIFSRIKEKENPKAEKKVLGILQFSYNEKLINQVNPKDQDILVIKEIIDDIEIWFDINEKLIEEFFLKKTTKLNI